MGTITWNEDGEPEVGVTLYGPDGEVVDSRELLLDSGADETSLPFLACHNMQAPIIGEVWMVDATGHRRKMTKYQGVMSFNAIGVGGEETRLYCRVPFTITSEPRGIFGKDQRIALHLQVTLNEGDRQGEIRQLPGPPANKPKRIPNVDPATAETAPFIPPPQPLQPVDPEDLGKGWKPAEPPAPPEAPAPPRRQPGITWPMETPSYSSGAAGTGAWDYILSPTTSLRDALLLQRALGIVSDARVYDLLRQAQLMRAFLRGPGDDYSEYWMIACSDRICFGRTKVELKLAAIQSYPDRAFIIQSPRAGTTPQRLSLPRSHRSYGTTVPIGRSLSPDAAHAPGSTPHSLGVQPPQPTPTVGDLVIPGTQQVPQQSTCPGVPGVVCSKGAPPRGAPWHL